MWSIDELYAFESVSANKQPGIFFLGGVLPERPWLDGGGEVGRR